MRLISADQLVRMRGRLHERPLTACSVTFAIANITFEVRSNMPGVMAELLEKYAEHAAHGEPQFIYHVYEGPEGYCYYCAHDGGWLWSYGELPSAAVAFLADAALMSALVHFDAELRSIHAAAVAFENRGALIVGDSTAGKTTTLLACARAGLQVYSDERGLLRGMTLHPFLRSCNIRAGARALLLDDERHDTLTSYLLTGAAVPLRKCFGGAAIAGPAPLRAVFVLSGWGDYPQITPIDAAPALPAISRWFDAKGNRLDRLASAIAILRQARCYRLLLGTPKDSAALIARTLEAL
jgi:hypothetical protein